MCACPTGYVIDINGDDCAPVCDYSSGEYVHVDTYGRKMCVLSCPAGTYISGRSCVTSCGANQLVGLDGRTCVSECPSLSKATKAGVCECSSSYLYLDSTSGVFSCVADCYDATRTDQVIGLDGKTCVTATP